MPVTETVKRSNAGVANRQGDVELRFAQVSAHQLTLAWLAMSRERQRSNHIKWSELMVFVGSRLDRKRSESELLLAQSQRLIPL